MIRHIVAWNLKEELTEAEKRQNALKIKAELEGLAGLIDGIVSIEVNINPAESSGREVVLISLFNEEKDLQAYQVHPEHQRAGGFVGSVTKDRVCLDFYEQV